MVHLGKKPFACEMCSFRSSQKRNIQKHMITIHGQKKDYSCDFCDYKCAHAQNLKKHVNLMHEQNQPTEIVIPRLTNTSANAFFG